ncbi:lysine transporter LysE [Cupriavidus sp. USMAHM13]|uniref:Lysine transporter LysE n=1 Tax=Cupriavidus malaysiensis TaxID=367825 RepID=A0ABN4TSE0_9BURK|nr:MULTISPECIES: LysE family translocator [Cupriavidus]AOZ02772.1 lysine transporter LysE [Cupriavidus sp. USMAHM13]AOZ09854.1 lysine transporter LysE [Cupriavidus malaysiensis]
MPDPATLSLFCGAVLMLMLSPGPNTAFVMAHGAACGLRGGVAAALGIAGADLLLTALTASGVTAVVVAWAPALDLIRYAGAAYLLWLAAKALRPARGAGGGGGTAAGASRPAGAAAVFVRGLLNCLLNPKALLFFLVFLPQFVVPGQGPVASQLLVLGALLSAISLLYHALLGALGASLRRLPRARPGLARLQSVALALLMAGLAVRLLLQRAA